MGGEVGGEVSEHRERHIWKALEGRRVWPLGIKKAAGVAQEEGWRGEQLWPLVWSASALESIHPRSLLGSLHNPW